MTMEISLQLKDSRTKKSSTIIIYMHPSYQALLLSILGYKKVSNHYWTKFNAFLVSEAQIYHHAATSVKYFPVWGPYFRMAEHCFSSRTISPATSHRPKQAFAITAWTCESWIVGQRTFCLKPSKNTSYYVCLVGVLFANLQFGILTIWKIY